MNGVKQKGLAGPGQFAAMRSTWQTGDRVELEFPLKMRLEAIDAQHTDTVALMRGPLVLMAVKEKAGERTAEVTREQLLGAKRISERQWQVETAAETMTLLPFTSIGDLPYTTYLKVA